MKLLAKIAFVTLAFTSLLVWNARGGDGGGGCPQCGCCDVKVVCRIVPVVTKTPKVEYSCKCEDFCAPGRSRCVGTETVTDCKGNCFEQKCFEPTCGKVYTKSTLVKTTTMVEKCTYKCVAETVCCKCGSCRGTADQTTTAPASGHPHFHHHIEPHPLHTQSN